MNRDLRQFVNESYINNDYDENEALIEEGAGLDLYHLLKDIRSAHEAKLNDFYNQLSEGDAVSARKTLNEIINNLQKAKLEVQKIDDSSFGSKLGTAAIKLTMSIGRIGKSALSGFVTGTASTAIVNKLTKAEKVLGKKDVKVQAIMTAIAAVPEIVKQMSDDAELINKRNAMIEKEIAKGAAEGDAKKKIGSLYKTSIIDYINSQIKEMKKIQVNLG